MARQGTALFVVVCSLVAACATHWDIDSYESPGANLAARQSFFWKGGDFATAALLKASVVASAETQIRDAVVVELKRKGYTEAATAAGADMVVSYQVAGIQKFVVADTPRVGAPSPNTVLSPSEVQPPPLSTVPREVSVRDGTVTLFVDDGASGKLLWRGEASTELRAGKAEQVARSIAQMASQIATAVPARPGH
jgi:hypothetical protein